MKKNIKYDLVIIGATGFTGRLVVEYLFKEYGALNKDFTWAIAGRNHEKLDALRKKFEQIDPLAKELNILISNNHDIASLDKITSVSKSSIFFPFSNGSTRLASILSRKLLRSGSNRKLYILIFIKGISNF